MKHIFIINPEAGPGKGIEKLIGNIAVTCKKEKVDYIIHKTRCREDSLNISRKIAESLKGEEGRFYACGGDGSLNDVLNGIVDFPNVSLGAVPIGTGNDTVRNFPEAGDFKSVMAQLRGNTVPVDVIKYEGIIDGTFQSRYCINMFNIGLDCNVVEMATNIKNKAFFKGHTAYLMSIVAVLIKKKGVSLEMIADGEQICNGEKMLCSIANGSYCGGGIYSSPQSSMNDGYFDINIVDDVSRSKFIRLFPHYKKGTHLEHEMAKDIFHTRKCRHLEIKPINSEELTFCTDGEIAVTKGLNMDLIEKKIKFVLPLKAGL